jgi:NADPH-dependent glutamate synthase beta subunit-like oxidoreductase/Pyruvate/2-oxoacid:ferredoxin oxidoreductase delta subunit
MSGKMNASFAVVKSTKPTSIIKTGGWRYLRPVHISRTSPCRLSCPLGNDIAQFISHIDEHDFEKAYQVIAEENPLPGVCGRVCFSPCEKNCNRGQYDEGISIRALERIAAEENKFSGNIIGKLENKKKRIAVVGSGPAGLSCAYFSERLGYSVSIIERCSQLGGMLRYGIPEYRLPRQVLDREIDNILSLGVTAKVNAAMGKDFVLEELLQDFAAVFLGIGAWKSLKMGIEGEKEFVRKSGLDFLMDANSGAPGLSGKVVVIGGGNTAFDVARSCLRHGNEPIIIYRRSKAEMPALQEEIDDAETEGIHIVFQASPTAIRSDNGKLIIRCVRTEKSESAVDGRYAYTPVKDSHFEIVADNVIPCVGEQPVVEELDPQVFAVNALQRCKVASLFCGGDMTSEVRSVSHAIGSGKRAAIGMDQFLRGEDIDLTGALFAPGGGVSFTRYLTNQHDENKNPIRFEEINLDYFERESRIKPSRILPVGSLRGDFTEIDKGLSIDGALSEANRCFKCGYCNKCLNCYVFCPDAAISVSSNREPVVNYDHCKGCGICARECPRGTICEIRED